MLKLGIAINDESRNVLFESYINNPLKSNKALLKKGLNIFKARLPVNILKEGKYAIQIISGLHNKQWINNTGNTSPTIIFEVNDIVLKSSNYIEQRGLLSPKIEWINAN